MKITSQLAIHGAATFLPRRSAMIANRSELRKCLINNEMKQNLLVFTHNELPNSALGRSRRVNA